MLKRQLYVLGDSVMRFVCTLTCSDEWDQLPGPTCDHQTDQTNTQQHSKTTTHTLHSNCLINNKRKRISSGTFFKELKATKTLGVVYLAFCACWLPGTIIAIIMIYDGEYFTSVMYGHRQFIWYMFIDVLPMVNTMIDPVIYSFTNTQFRRAVIDVWRKLMGKARRRPSMFVSAQGTELVSLAN